MKYFLFTICFLLLTLGIAPPIKAQEAVPNQPGQVAQIQWYSNYNQAVQSAQKARLPILLFFTGSDWCGWCKKLQQEVFSSPDFAQAAGNSFIFVEVDFPKNKQLPPEEVQQNAQLKQKYGVSGFPTVVILDSNQNFVAQSGYRPGGGRAYADYLRQLLQ
jgi:protein disulfide-isomerase